MTPTRFRYRVFITAAFAASTAASTSWGATRPAGDAGPATLGSSSPEAERSLDGDLAEPTGRLGNAQQWVLSFEDIAQAHYTVDGAENDEGDSGRRVESSMKSFFGALSFPTLAVDYFVVEGLSLGGSGRYWLTSSSQTLEERDTATGVASDTVLESTDHHLTFGPRIGYSLPLADGFDLWGRVGVIGQYDYSSERGLGALATTNGAEASSWVGVAAQASILAVYTPSPHLSLTAGPGLTQFAVWSHSRPASGRKTEIFEESPMFTFSAGVALNL